jgi:hypothetical protein
VKRLLLSLAIFVPLWAVACGGGGGTVNLPPPTGKYSLSSLKGTYAFMTNGEVITNNGTGGTPMARVGSFTADGAGNITGGVEDINAAGTVTSAVAINSGSSYTVNADGRGTITLNLTANGIPASINFGIVLTSTSAGLLIDETSTSSQASTGSGNFVLQTGGPFTVGSVAGTYVFDFSGQNFSLGTSAPLSLVGEFAASGGVISTGFEDVNDNFALTNGSITGNLTPDVTNLSTFGRGTATIGGETYAFYIVDSTRVRFIDASGSGNMLSGDAVLQQSIPATISAINSGFAFVVAGSDGNGGLTRVGRFTANGAAVTSVLMDYNDSTGAHQTNTASSASLTYDPTTGRGTVTFQDPNLQIPFVFVFYLSSATQGVLQETTGSTAGAKGIVAVTDGTIAAQIGGPFSSSNITGTYALNWSGLSFQQNGQFIDEEDLVGQATVSSLALSGAADIFQFTVGAPEPNIAVSGSITVNGHGTGDDTMRNTVGVKLSGASQINFDVYFVSPRLAFISSHGGQSPTRILVGVLQFQN